MGLGYLIRVTVTDQETGQKYLEPNVYATPPPLLIATDGMPSYGQIMLSETIASFILVLTSVTVRNYEKKQSSMGAVVWAALAMAISLGAVNKIFRESSGGIANPAVAISIIIWQEFTLSVDRYNDHSQWTYEYATSFIIGPIAGAFMAGVCYNMQQHWIQTMRNFKKDPDMTESAVSEASGQSFIDSSREPKMVTPKSIKADPIAGVEAIFKGSKTHKANETGHSRN